MSRTQRRNETRKKEIELSIGTKLAMAINAASGTDYIAECAQCDPPDVRLVSSSGRHPARDVEVVTAPLEPLAREDHGNLLKLRSRLERDLRARDFPPCWVQVDPKESAVRRGVGPDELKLLADLLEEGRSRDLELDDVEIYARSPRLAALISGASVFHAGGSHVLVSLGHAVFVERDGRWIEEAIHSKEQRYRGQYGEPDLRWARWTLAIGALSAIDRNQTEAFLSGHPSKQLPFAEIWLVSGFEGVIQLKRSPPR